MIVANVSPVSGDCEAPPRAPPPPGEATVNARSAGPNARLASASPAKCVDIIKAGAGEAGEGRRDDDVEDGPETEDMFGFTQGTSILEKGKFEISGGAEGAFGRRFGRYRAGARRSMDSASSSARSAGQSARQQFRRLLDRAEMASRQRGAGSPFGLTFIVEPETSFLDADSGERGRGMVSARASLSTPSLCPERCSAD